MLISTPEELRLYAPANAIDHIESMAGFLNASEHDFLEEKLGAKLYNALTNYYRDMRKGEEGISTFLAAITNGDNLPPYAQLLSLAQRIVAFDALARAIDMQAISVNGAGVNMGIADDYPKADRNTITAYKTTCIKEAHAAINHLLQTLEAWTQEVAAVPADSLADNEDSTDSSVTDDTIAEKNEITTLWKNSRYFYLAAGLIIPSATVLQEYLDIYGSREKFILMLPDLRTIQEDIIVPILGEDFVDYLIATVLNGFPNDTTDTEKKVITRTIHLLRKAVARHLEARTMQLKVGDPRRETAHNEAVQRTTDLSEYLQSYQSDLPQKALKAFTTSPLYVAPVPDHSSTGDSEYTPQFENNASGSVMFVTPALD